jgi:hypothetical protein
MLNGYVPITFKDGATASLLVPKFTVAYAIVRDLERKVTVLTTQKTPKDESGYAALRRAKAKFPKLVWCAISGIACGIVRAGAAHEYWKAVLERTEDNSLRLIINPKDPMLGAYGYITDREAAVGMGQNEDEIDKWLMAILDPASTKLNPEPNSAVKAPSVS